MESTIKITTLARSTARIERNTLTSSSPCSTRDFRRTPAVSMMTKFRPA